MTSPTTVFANAIRFLGFQKLLTDRSEVEQRRKENARLREELILAQQLGSSLAAELTAMTRNFLDEEECARLANQTAEQCAIMAEQCKIRALTAERNTLSIGEELREQVELNEELISQWSVTEIQFQGHSSMVDAQRVQVLTQFTMRSLDLRNGLLNALLSPFAMNVAKHLITKLQGAGALREGQSTQEVSPLVLLKKPVLELGTRTST